MPSPSQAARLWPWIAAGVASAGLVTAALGLAGNGVDAATAVCSGLVAAWLAAGVATLARPPVRRFAGLVIGAAAVGAVACAGLAWPGAVGQAVASVAGALTVAAFLHILLALPDGALGTPRHRGWAAAGYAVALAVGVIGAAAGTLPSWTRVLLWLTAGAAGAWPAHRRYRASTGRQRQRLQWMGCAALLAVEAALILVALRILVHWPAHAGVAAAASTVLLPAALVAGSAPNLTERVDRVLVGTVSLTGVTSVVAAVYVVVILGLGHVPTPEERSLLALSMAAAAVAVLIYHPARARFSEYANRLVYGERQAPDDVLRTFGSRMTRALPLEELLLQLAESLKRTLELSAAEVWTGTKDVLDRSVSVPHRGPASLHLSAAESAVVSRAGVSGTAWALVWLPALVADRAGRHVRVAPLVHSGELLGLIVIERLQNAEAFTDEDERMLTELARQVALGLHNAQLDSALQHTLDEVRRTNQQLQASRARIVSASDAERRRIERDLHDGAQQHLVALAVNLRLARDLVGEDPEGAEEVLGQLTEDVRETIQQLRDLAHGIYPQLLVDAGLPEALQAAATRSPLDVSIDAGVGRYPAEVEAAVYFCCLEALQNAAKHAPGSRVAVRVWQEAGGLLFEVTDDGPGFDPATVHFGHGYVNMSDRLGAIGGTVRWSGTPGAGSRVSGTLPLVPRASEVPPPPPTREANRVRRSDSLPPPQPTDGAAATV